MMSGQGDGPTPLWRRLTGWLRRFAGLFPSRAVVVVAALGLVAYFALVQTPPVWPFLTAGRIYVESPGVYTRERLVNDRYSQDFWLKSQLTLLDGSDDLLRHYRFSQAQVGAKGEAAPEPAPMPLAFQDEFVLRAAIRDKVRQMILENLLDDRHDLTGNSIYGLKFETAVVPGANTHHRPYVVVRIDAETLPSGMEAADFLADATSAHNAETGAAFDATRKQYNGWRRNVESRLNGYLEQAVKAVGCAAPDPAPEAQAADEGVARAGFAPGAGKPGVFAPGPDAAQSPPADPAAPDTAGGWSDVSRGRIADALRNVLGVEPREVSFSPWPANGPFGTIEIPEPWSRYFQVQVRRNPDQGLQGDCADRFNIQLRPVFATVMLVERRSYDAFVAQAAVDDQQKIRIIGTTGAAAGERRVLVNQRFRDPFWSADEAERTFVESLTEHELALLRSRAGPAPLEECLVSASEPARGMVGADAVAKGDCLLRGERYYVHASQYDFIRAISKSIPYSYAVFPRGDVEGVLTDRTIGAGLEAPEGAGASLGLSGLMRSREVGAEPVVVNFAGGRSQDVAVGDFDFGWAIVRPGRQRPSQVSQLVLVSVPAYLDKLDLWVETGWLDRNSDPIGPPPVAEAVGPPAERSGARRLTRMTVALPPDYEAIDTLVVGGTRRQGPVIDDLHFRDRTDLGVTACRNADILIPGERLWRSTSVTLGGQIASKITVMPDMRGIVASFEPVGLPPGARIADGDVLETLTVWTSEGRDEAPLPVRIRMPADTGVADACPPTD